MNLNKNKIIVIALAVLVILITSLVFFFSLKDNQASHVASGAISDMIAPNDTMNDKVSDVIVDVGEQMPEIGENAEWVTPKNILEALIRKLAHLVEFAALGVAVMGLVLSVKREWGIGFAGFGFFYVLAVAVADEYIQSFSDRSSSIGDVLLDFSGALFGFALTVAVFFLIRWIKTKKRNRITAEEQSPT